MQGDLKLNKNLREDVKQATDELMGKMRELSDTLGTTSFRKMSVEGGGVCPQPCRLKEKALERKKLIFSVNGRTLRDLRGRVKS